jgi:hypothetical protein
MTVWGEQPGLWAEASSTEPPRLLVTGSRDWTDAGFVERKLEEVLEFGPFVLVQGDNPDGVDGIAKAWAIRRGVEHEDVPADWSRPCTEECYHAPRFRRNGDRYCPVAGNLRNQEMVDRGAFRCLAFPKGKSPGTRDCIRRAKAAGIWVVVFEG